MHILPSRGRPHLLQRFFDEGKPQERGCVVIDDDQEEMYAAIQIPRTWVWLTISQRSGYVKAANAAFNMFPDEPWYALAGDDSVGRTPGWDTTLAEIATPNRLSWGNDLVCGHCTQPFIGGDLCRALGWFLHPALGHLWCDTVWGDIQKALRIGTYRRDVIHEHLHFSIGKAERDQTYRERQTRGDREAYAQISNFEMPEILEKLRLCLK